MTFWSWVRHLTTVRARPDPVPTGPSPATIEGDRALTVAYRIRQRAEALLGQPESPPTGNPIRDRLGGRRRGVAHGEKR
jgi:hypothetical protein